MWTSILTSLVLLAAAATFGVDAGEAGAKEWPLRFADDFGKGAGHWEAACGEWQVKDGRYTTADQAGGAIAYAHRAPVCDTQTIEVGVRAGKRLTHEGWSVTGVLLFSDLDSFWLLGLTEGPDGRRYVDFLENYRGHWQAQTVEGLKLALAAEQNMGLAWEYGKDYRLKVELDAEGIAGTVLDAGDGKVLATRRYLFGAADALRTGMAALYARGCAVEFANVSVRAPEEPRAEAALNVRVEEGAQGNIAMLADALPGCDATVPEALAKALRAAGFGVTLLSADAVSDPAVLTPERFFLYVIPNARVYPAAGARALQMYLRRKGHLMVLGGPAFERPVAKYKGQWVDAQAVREATSRVRPERLFLDFGKLQDLKGWSRPTNDAAIAGGIELEDGGPEGVQRCAKVWTANLTGWCGYSSPLKEAFPPGHGLLCFQAKGDARTPQLVIELGESDGSRWMAVAGLTEKWQPYALGPESFAYWHDSPTKGQRGGPRDGVQFQQVARINFGWAMSHTMEVGGGPHAMWLAAVGTAAHPFAGFEAVRMEELSSLETIFPAYKVYTPGQVKEPQVCPSGVLDRDLKLPAPASAVFSQRRPRGAGYGNQRRWRWVPLASASGADQPDSGVLLWMLLNDSFPCKGSLFSVCGVNDPEALKSDAWTAALVQLARRTREGSFLYEAGARHFAYWPGEKVELGANVRSFGAGGGALKVALRIHELKDPGKAVFAREADVTLQPGEAKTLTFTWEPPIAPDRERFFVRTQLLRDGKVIDFVGHGLDVTPDLKPAPGDLLTVKGGDFYLKGEKWYPAGVNYWPLYVAGMDAADYWPGWLAPAYYDPEEVEGDLERMEKLGINLVSIQMGGPKNIRNLLDFMRRCENHRIKVNGFLSGASPLEFNEDAVRQFIQEARLADNPALFAYDIIWEPGNWVFNGENRKNYDRDWERWLVERYGGLADAEADWGFPVPRAGGQVSSPSDQQLSQDGKWRVLVAAYRRFMDDLMSRKWNDATRKLKRIDPNHLVSFRQGNTLPQDFTFTATPKHIDFICPEGYSIPDSEDGYHAACLITRYVQHTTRGKPVVWSEFGTSVWDAATMRPSAKAIARQAGYHELFYRMVLETGANGTIPWWWPGGYRVDEKSDFGIMNEDGSPRPSAQLIACYGPRMKTPREQPPPDEWLTVDRDAHPGGYWRIAFHEGKDAYARAAKAGIRLGVKTAGTGTNSCNTPLVAVGNTAYNGKNPPKFLNAEFNSFEVKNARGEWVSVTNGAEVPVAAGRPVLARASVGNLQEAEWLTPESAQGAPGAVCLASTPQSGLSFKRPIPRNTAYLADAELGEFALSNGVTAKTTVTLQMTAEGRAWFGEKLELTLVPAGEAGRR
jgi:hypothetical protein